MIRRSAPATTVAEMATGTENPYLTAREAAAELNVSRATLYAYVSRGLIRSEPVDGARARRYRADDVRALRQRKSPRGEAGTAPGPFLPGLPTLDSAITLITDDAYYYRGRDATALAAVASLESLAGLLWQCGDADPFAQTPDALPDVAVDRLAADLGLGGINLAVAALAAAQARDLRAYNLEPRGVARTGAGIVRLIAAAVAGTAPAVTPVHVQLAEAWRAPPGAAMLIRAALVLAADHELNASAFTVRCVAATRATPYAAVIAGLSALEGPRHGGLTARVAALFDEALAHADLGAAVAARVRRGERLPGFGHPLYPQGDPRWFALKAMMAQHSACAAGLERAFAIATAATEMTDQQPNIDFGLVALQRALGLPAGAPLALFATGRAVGWIAHAQEQYARPELIRPRARYTGEEPQPARPG